MYIVFLTIEYLTMMYYIVRLADMQSFNKVFGIFENFLDVTKNENEVQITSVGGDTPTTMSTDYMETKAIVHIVANLLLVATYGIFMLLFVNRLFEIKSFDQTIEQSYLLKSLSAFMVGTSTVL